MKAFFIVLVILSWSCVGAELEAVSRKDVFQGSRTSRRKRDLTGTTLRVVGILESPYTMKKLDASPPANSAHTLSQYEGFIPDLLNMITDRTHIDFDYYLVPDGRYGAETPNGTWNGMIGEVIKRTIDKAGDGADIAAAGITITSRREDVVDFINPFQHLGLSILYKRPLRRSSEIPPISFEVLAALSPGVWLIILASFILISLSLWLINRFNPYEWRGRYQRGHATQEESESLNIFGAMWFTFCTLQWQGYDSAPRSFGSRILAGFWFMFVTITLATYTGSLINNLFWASTMKTGPSREPFQDLRGLLQNTRYQFGCIYGGSTYQFLTKNAEGEVYDKIRKKLLGPQPDRYLVNTTMAGVNRVLKGNYAFITDSSMVRYVAARNCQLGMTDKIFAKRAFGMPIRNNTDEVIREALHGAILELMEEGDIEALEEKWFDNDGLCNRDEPVRKPSSLFLNSQAVVTVGMFTGPMIILLVGIILSALVTVAEVLYFKFRGRFQPEHQPRGSKLQEVDADDN